MELGKDFAFVGNQYHLEVSEKDYYIDLLFYNTKLPCYVVLAHGYELENNIEYYFNLKEEMVSQSSILMSVGSFS